MLYWTTYPFVRILLVFIFGILAARYSTFHHLLEINLLFPLSIFAAVCLCRMAFQKISNRVWGNLLLIIVFAIGFTHKNASHQQKDQAKLANEWSQCKAYIAMISSFPVDKGKYIKQEIEVNVAIGETTIFTSPIKILLYQKKTDSTAKHLRYGDKIRIEGKPTPVLSPRNPHEFDYSAYLVDQGIYYHQFAGSDQIQLLARGEGNPIMQSVYRLRGKLEHIITSNIIQTKEQAVVKALLLGIKGQLDSEIKSAYASAGAMHVLAVSGLHVSVVCLLLNWIFKLLPAGRFQRVASPTCSILALWTYALLTGFSPSILRAATMFSLILFSKILNRRANVFNTLAFAAFILLLYNPNFLFAVGFQLSFLAVAGILYVYPKIYELWQVNHWLGDKIWQLTCVSIAAQLATFPLSLYYFHQFPTYFLLTNLVVIPAASIIMMLGIALIIFGHWLTWIGPLLEYIANTLNRFIQFIQYLEWSTIDWIQISPLQAALIYLLILAFILLFYQKKTYYVSLMFLAALGVTIDQSARLITQSNKHQLLFYSLKNALLVDKNLGLRAQLFSPDSTIQVDQFQYQITPFRRTNLLPIPDTATIISTDISDFAKIQVIQKKKILYLHKPIGAYKVTSPLVSDVVVISNQALESLTALSEIAICRKVIVDNTNSRPYINKLKKESIDFDVEFIDLMNQSHTILLSGNKKFLDMLF